MVLWRGRESSALKDGRISQLSRFRHVNIDVHARAVLVSIVVTRPSLRGRCRPIVSPPIQIVAKLFLTTSVHN